MDKGVDSSGLLGEYVKRVTLEYVHVMAFKALSRSVLDSLNMDLIKSGAQDLVLMLNAKVMARKAGKIRVCFGSFPLDWWEHFKQRWFPAWAQRYWPVKCVVREKEVEVLNSYPEADVKLPDAFGSPVLRFRCEGEYL